MRYVIITLGIVGVLAVSGSAPPESRATTDSTPSPFTDALVQDVATLESKLVSLAEAMSEEALEWAPSDEVLTSAEVFMHVAAYNYYYPSMAGAVIPAGAGVTTDYATVSEFENKARTRDQLVADLRTSFEHLGSSVAAITAEELDDDTEVFGRTTTVQAAWFGTVTHIHEHLGQLVAYARANGITPPWSM
ncbi:MAG: DinB family protein [Gemmatimonadetes bacterium]|nr:DinB family protein [Gemmatimonadota bacterium]